ncbi:MAG: winged helix-turn-helix domain-containing protein [Pseudomonadota bacterium]
MSDWYFSEDDSRLICPEQIVQLTAKAAAVLACLRRHQGRVVTTQTFLDEVWPGLNVTSDLVREYIHDLRTALNDEAKQPRFIETVRGKGFRLIADIHLAGADLASREPLPPAENRPTVAVLKPVFQGAGEVAEIAEGVASEIINQLVRFHYVGVIARQSTFSSGEVTDIRAFAQDVNANYILESNFSQIGDVVRARIQLVDATSGRNLWGERIDLAKGDPLAAVDAISNMVVLALTGWHGELHRAEFKSVTRQRKANLNAFEHFILGCDLEMRLDAENLKRSLSHLEKSVELDPTFARAWLVLALELRWAYAVIPGRDRSYLERSRIAFETAFNLAPTDPVNLALMAMNTARIGSLDAALAMVSRAEAGMVGDSDAMVCIATAKAFLAGDVERASEIFDRVLEANTAPPSWIYFAEAGIAFSAGHYERSIAASHIGPQEISALVFRCLSHAMLGQKNEALAAYRFLVTFFPNVDFQRFANNFPIANDARRKDYDQAVERLFQMLETTEISA